jgi:protein SCO1/2
MNMRRLALAALAALGLATAGCNRAPEAPATGGAPAGPARLAGAAIGGPFTLVDQDGRTVTQDSFAGQWRLMFFGFTHCPDICPTDLARNAQALRAFTARDPERAARVQPIFVSVDPERDTPAVLKAYVANFPPRLIGLTGSPAQVEAAVRAFRVYAARRGDGPDYLVDHSSMTYLFDPAGRPVTFWSSDEPAEAVAAGLAALVR